MSDPKFLQDNALNLMKMAVYNLSQPEEPDWQAQAQMYAKCLGKVKEFCEIQHKGNSDLYRHVEPTEEGQCFCHGCVTRRRVLRIIADNLK